MVVFVGTEFGFDIQEKKEKSLQEGEQVKFSTGDGAFKNLIWCNDIVSYPPDHTRTPDEGGDSHRKFRGKKLM